MAAQSAQAEFETVVVVSAREGFRSAVDEALRPLGARAAADGAEAIAAVVDGGPEAAAWLACWRAPAMDPPPPVLRVGAAGGDAAELALAGAEDPCRLSESLRALVQLGRLSATLRAERQQSQARQAEFRAGQHRKDEVTAHVVHDLKNRLASILPNAQFLLMESGLSEDGRGAANDIVSASESMHRMAVNLVDISRAETGGLHTSLGPLDLGLLVQEVRTKLSKRAADKQQRLDAMEVAAGVQVTGDRGLLRRLVENLLDNAMHYAPAGSTIRLAVRPAAEGTVELSIADEGHAMAAHLRDKAFDREAQLELGSEPTTRISAGLGLVFCRLVAEVHRGRIAMVDRQPKGNAFVVRLPA